MKTKTPLKWYIKERNNPQLGVYFVPMGQLSRKEARENQASLYGYNKMHALDTEQEYLVKIVQLRDSGERVNGL